MSQILENAFIPIDIEVIRTNFYGTPWTKQSGIGIRPELFKNEKNFSFSYDYCPFNDNNHEISAIVIKVSYVFVFLDYSCIFVPIVSILTMINFASVPAITQIQSNLLLSGQNVFL